MPSLRCLIFILTALTTGILCCPANTLAAQENDAPAQAAFEFRSGFWINLHHFLYLQGRLHNAAADHSTPTSPAQVPDTRAQSDAAAHDSPERMTGDQQKAWNAAVKAYAADWSSRDLLHNENMILINDRLSDLADRPDITGKVPVQCVSGLTSEMTAALREAAPVYRARWWADQDRENRAWITAATSLMRTMGPAFSAELADVYQRGWPQRPLRVDVVWYAGPTGAYTSLDPVHLTIGSHDPRNRDVPGFVVLYREASQAISIRVNRTITQDYRQLGKPIPRDLWPALLFYTAGELWRRTGRKIAEGHDSPTDTPRKEVYEYRAALNDRGWNMYETVLERYWQQYLDGTLRMETAIARIANVL